MYDQAFTIRSAAHDIRGYLANAYLATEALNSHDDRQVSVRAQRIENAIEQVVSICENELVEQYLPASTSVLGATSLRNMFYRIACLNTPVSTARIAPIYRIRVSPAVSLNCNENYLFRVLYNLAVNATRAISEHGGTRIALRARREGNQIECTVSDDGPGLPSHVIAHLYPQMNDVSHPRTEIGFGLMTAVGLAAQMNGKLNLLTSDSAGTSFCLTLPASNSDTGLSNLPPCDCSAGL